MRTLKLRNLTTPQVEAFGEMMPNLTAARTIGGAPLVELTRSTITVRCHPAVGLDVADPGTKLARALQFSDAHFTGRLSALDNLIRKLPSAEILEQ